MPYNSPERIQLFEKWTRVEAMFFKTSFYY